MKSKQTKSNPKTVLGIIMSFCMMMLFTFSSHAQCDHTFNMYDSYGDGWNGSYVDITVNGVSVADSLTGANMGGFGNSGLCGSNIFSAGSGDLIDLVNWTTGSYTGEVSWDITDGDGNVIATGGHGVSPAAAAYCSPPPTCSNIFTMYDSYGDGWNGSYVGLTVNGTIVVDSLTGANMGGFGNSGPCGSYSLTVSTGDLIDVVNWTTGSYTSEVSWDITDAMGTVIASGAHGATGPALADCFIPSTIPGCTDSTAWNFDPSATVSDSSCLYGCPLTTNVVAVPYLGSALTNCGNGDNVTSSNSSYSGYYLSGEDETYEIVGTGNYILVSLTSTTSYTGITVFDACPTDGGAVVASSGSSSSNESTSFSSTAGATYYITIDTWAAPLCIASYDLSIADALNGCTNATACNYDSTANVDDGSCTYPGCTDPLAVNYSASAGCDDGSCSYACTAAPYSENFDAGIGTFTNNGWTLDANGTGSSGTGPSDDITGGGNYMYYETSGAAPATITLTSECLDISALAAPALRFYYHMYGATMGTLDVSVNGTSVWSLSGDQGNAWVPAQIDLSAYAGVDITVVFTGTKGSSYTGDMAIDAIEVDELVSLVVGCTDSTACNFDPLANADDGSCTFVVAGFDCAGNCLNGGTETNIKVQEISTFGSMYGLVQYGGSWSLIDVATGTAVAGAGSGETADLCLLDGCYEISGISGSGSSYAFAYSLDGGATYTTPGAFGATGTDQFYVGVGVCTVLGCTDSTAVNYNAAANSDDGSCTYGTPGCTDVLACNYDASATVDDGSCTYAVAGYDCAGNCLNGGTSTSISVREVGSFGNYSLVTYGGTWSLTDDQGNVLASDADGDDVTLCLPDGCYDIIGNSGSGASYPFGYDVNGTGTYTVPGAAGTAGGSAQFAVGSGSCFVAVLGCTDTLASNYNATANTDDGSCIYTISGCTDTLASNYNALATVDDGSCNYAVSGCTDSTACNYNALATVDDGSCGTLTTISNRESGIYSLVQYGGTWSLTDDQGTVLASQTDGDDVTLCLGDGCYTITGNSGSGASYPWTYSLNGGAYVTPGGAGNAGGTDYISIGGACVAGCTNPLATNYNSSAVIDDGSCTYPSCLAVAPYTENFSAGTLPSGICPNGWSISATSGNWAFAGNPGYNASTTMGNNRAAGTFAWIDFSGSDVGVAMQVEDIDISGLSSPSMTFDYFSDIGTSILPYPNTMYVEAYDGSAWNVIGTFDQFTSGWETKLVDLAGADVAGTVTLRFRGESGSGGMTSTSDFYNDLLVDDISVDEMPPAGCTDPTAFNFDPTATIDDGSCIPVIFGCMDPLAGNFNVSANTADTCIYAVIGCMDPLACDYDPLATVSATCTYVVPGFTCSGSCASGVGAHSESFEDAPAMGLYTQGPWTEWTYDAATSTFTGTNGWRADNLGTGSSGTGPLNGAASADGDYYLYCETSGQYNKVANLNSSCVDLANFSAPNFVASVSMNGATIGTLNIDVSTDGGATWNTEWTMTGNQGQPWFDAIVDLSPYSGQIVQVRMNYTSGASFSGDCAIDNLRFMEAPASGCMDPLACNYDPAATIDDGSCYILTASTSAVDVTCNGSTDGSASVTANASPLIYMWDNGASTDSISGLAPGTYLVTVEDNTGCVATASATVGEPSAIALSAVVGNESPAGSSNGSIDLTASGGVPCITVQTLSSHNPGLSQNGSNGCHFNITNTSASPLTITDIAQGSYTYSGANTITVYSMPAPYDQTTSAGSWAQVGQAAVTVPAGGSFTAPVYSAPVVLSSPVIIPAGATYGFYVGGSLTVSYATATAAGAVGSSVASDAYISISSGHGGTFGAGSFSPRSPLVQVGYGDPTASAYTFAWGNGVTTEDLSGLAAGTYSVTATDCNGCTGSASYTVVVQATPGCTDSTACNYNALAFVDDGSCILPDGCTDSTALNYNASATCDDGTCIAAVYGCTDPLALNYDANANTDDGSCSYHCANTAAYPSGAVAANPYGAVTVSTCNYLSEYSTISGVGAGESYTAAISGVNANPGYIVVYEGSSAGNFIAQGSAPLTWTSTVAGTYYIHWLVDSTCATATGCHVTTLTGNAVVSVPGCTDSTALNYDPLATVDDGSCILCVYGCTDTTAFNYNAAATCDDGSCMAVVYGCTDATACNYYAGANVDDGSCEWTSCIGSCAGPDVTGLLVSNIIDNRVELNFDNMNSYDATGAQVCRVDQIRIKYREAGTSSWSQKNMASPTGTDPITGICNSTQNTSKLVLNLTAATTYEWEVKVWYCDGQSTGFVAGPNFTTLGSCPNVANVAVTSPSTTKATFTWDASNGSYSFVRLKARPEVTLDPINSWFNIGGMGVAYGTNTKDKNNLTPGDSYRGQARTWCDPNGGPYRAATWSPLVFWTQPTTIRLEGSDAIANLDVYPNPSRDVFNVTFTSEEVQDLDVRVVNVVGEVIYTENLEQFVGEYTKAIDLATYTKGIYFLEITTNNGVVNKKLILQ